MARNTELIRQWEILRDYPSAWVPEYQEIRQFALERIRTLAVTQEQFQPRPLPADPFASSIGVFSDNPDDIEIEFDASVAEYVASREWHRSQEVKARGDGSIVMRLCVCNDRPLRTWILGFGATARVIAPAAFAREIADEFAAAHQRYVTATGKRKALKMTLPDRTVPAPASLNIRRRSRGDAR